MSKHHEWRSHRRWCRGALREYLRFFVLICARNPVSLNASRPLPSGCVSAWALLIVSYSTSVAPPPSGRRFTGGFPYYPCSCFHCHRDDLPEALAEIDTALLDRLAQNYSMALNEPRGELVDALPYGTHAAHSSDRTFLRLGYDFHTIFCTEVRVVAGGWRHRPWHILGSLFRSWFAAVSLVSRGRCTAPGDPEKLPSNPKSVSTPTLEAKSRHKLSHGGKFANQSVAPNCSEWSAAQGSVLPPGCPVLSV